LSSIKDSGFTIYSVEGSNLPGPRPLDFPKSQLRKNQMYISGDEIYQHW